MFSGLGNTHGLGILEEDISNVGLCAVPVVPTCQNSSTGVGPLSACTARGRHATAVLKSRMPIAFAMPLHSTDQTSSNSR